MNDHKKFELESSCVELINPKKSNIIVSTIYRHRESDVTQFNNILKNVLIKNKKGDFSGDFSVDLMHYSEDKPTNEFL